MRLWKAEYGADCAPGRVADVCVERRMGGIQRSAAGPESIFDEDTAARHACAAVRAVDRRTSSQAPAARRVSKYPAANNLGCDGGGGAETGIHSVGHRRPTFKFWGAYTKLVSSIMITSAAVSVSLVGHTGAGVRSLRFWLGLRRSPCSWEHTHATGLTGDSGARLPMGTCVGGRGRVGSEYGAVL